MRASILAELGELKDLAQIFVLTFNIDFGFVERWLLNALRASGHPRLSILADATCAADSFAREHAYAPRLGKRYRVIPVPMGHSAAFHPKAILAISSKRATLFVGSGNTSFGGWVDNAEVWTRYDSDAGGLPELLAFRGYLEACLRRLLDPEPLRRELTEALRNASWAQEPLATGGLVGRAGDGESLWARARRVLGDGGFDELIAAAPYFDRGATAIRVLAERCRAVTLFVPTGATTLTKEARAGLDPSWKVAGTRVIRGDKDRTAFVHATWYAFVRGDRATVLTGSANASNAAWLSNGSAGNAELLVVREMSVDELREQYMDELELIEEPELIDDAELDEDGEDDLVAPALIAVARREHGVVRVTWHSTLALTPRALSLDGSPLAFRAAGTVLDADAPLTGRKVTLTLVDADSDLHTVDAWLDDERELSASAGERRLSDAVDQFGRGRESDLTGWLALLEPFEAELREAAAAGASMTTSTRTSRDSEDSSSYTWSDVFPDENELAVGDILGRSRVGSRRTADIRLLLLRAIGGLIPDEGDDDDDDVEGTEEGDEDVGALRPASGRLLKSLPPPSEQARQRAARTVKRITETLTKPRLLESRPGALLQRDITILVTLLRVARKEQWIDEASFFELSMLALRTLFLSGEPVEDPKKGAEKKKAQQERLAVGWLERRRRLDPAFATQLATPSFVATTCAWLSDTLDAAQSDADRGAVEVVGLASFSSLRWLFALTRRSDYSLDLARAVRVAAMRDPAEQWQRAQAVWRRWDRSGRAVLKLMGALSAQPIAAWRTSAGAYVPARGSLVWTGKKTLGIFVGLDIDASPPRAVVTPLMGATEEKFQREFILPIDAVIAAAVHADGPEWLAAAQATLGKFYSASEEPEPDAWLSEPIED